MAALRATVTRECMRGISFLGCHHRAAAFSSKSQSRLHPRYKRIVGLARLKAGRQVGVHGVVWCGVVGVVILPLCKQAGMTDVHGMDAWVERTKQRKRCMHENGRRRKRLGAVNVNGQRNGSEIISMVLLYLGSWV